MGTRRCATSRLYAPCKYTTPVHQDERRFSTAILCPRFVSYVGLFCIVSVHVIRVPVRSRHKLGHGVGSIPELRPGAWRPFAAAEPLVHIPLLTKQHQVSDDFRARFLSSPRQQLQQKSGSSIKYIFTNCGRY